MKKLITFSFALSLLMTAQFASAQSVDAIIDQYVAATGGKGGFDTVQSVYLEGTKEVMGNVIAVRVTKVQGKLSRTEFDFGGATGFFLTTQTEKWNYIPIHSAAPEKTSDDEVVASQTDLDIFGPWVNYAAKGNKVALQGKDTLDGNENYKIKLTTASGKDLIFWIDAKTYLLSQVSQKSIDGDGEQLTIFRNYSAVNGIQFAHSVEIKGGSGAPGPVTIDKITVNQPVDPKLYQPQ
jgi:hypothetical protein